MIKVQDWIRNNLKGDPVIWTVVILLSMLSTLVVYSAASAPAFRYMGGNTEHYLIKHSLLLLLGLGATWVAHNINYVYYSKISRIALLLSVPLLILTYFNGVTENDASRWLMIPIINQTFQTSDLAKLALITNLASMLAKRQKNIEDFKTSLLPILLWCGTICGLIALSDLSTAMMLFATCMVIMFVGRVPINSLLKLIGIGIVFLGLALIVGQRGNTAVSRIISWWGMATGSTPPEQLPYQVQQSFIAIAKGGFFGVGWGHSSQSYHLPVAYADYIFAIINEEYGVIMGVIVILLFLVLLYRGMKVATTSEKAFGGLLSVGLTFSLVIQAMINMMVVVGLAPVTGLSLPILSMGGTSLLFTGVSLGIILSVSRGDLREEIRGMGRNSVIKREEEPMELIKNEQDDMIDNSTIELSI
ncbi:MAG: FtsW/RodA/SpoVE family cell cycle protein [Cyclobacteriaceae bacterium]